MNKYLKQIKKYPLLTADEEYVLFQQYYGGSLKAYNNIIESNLLNAYNISYAFHLKNSSVDLDEMVGAANECLINCVLNFSTDKGYRFYAYLYSAVINTLVKLINLQKNISLPQHLYILFGKIESGYKASFSIKNMREYEMYSKYLYQRFDDDNEEGHDFDITDNSIDRAMLQEERVKDVDLILSGLSEVELYIITNFYGLQNRPLMMLKTIKQNLKMKQGTVSASKSRALVKMAIRYKKLNKNR